MSSGWAAREGFDGHEPPVPGDAGPLLDPAQGPGGVAPDEGLVVLHGLGQHAPRALIRLTCLQAFR